MSLAIGGLGVFLLGMHWMTDGLRLLAGTRLRRWLRTYTRSPWSGAATGAVSTAVIQSSSATTVIAIGLVGAGVMEFSQALGVIFGANIGTTITGWLVAIFGFQTRLSAVLAPVVLLGAFLQLFGHGRRARVGQVLSSFGLVFIGLEMMKNGMAVFEDMLTPHDFPGDTVVGRLLLVGIGAVITIVLQSSSAGIATAMAALHMGTINLGQAASMAIGMDVGTTVTGLLASMGGSVAMRRTGIAHVVYNLLTGVMAFVLLPLYLFVANRSGFASSPALAMVGFHTSFNTLGVLLILPFTQRFADWIERVVHPRKTEDEPLDSAALGNRVAALDVLYADLEHCAIRTLHVVRGILALQETDRDTVVQLSHRVDLQTDYIGRIDTDPGDPDTLSLLHTIDHLERLLNRVMRTPDLRNLKDHDESWGFLQALRTQIDLVLQAEAPQYEQAALVFGQLEQRAQEQHAAQRMSILEQTAGQLQAEKLLHALDGVRWLLRTCGHIHKVLFYLNQYHSRIEEKNTE